HAPVGNENLKEIFSWIKDTTHIKLKFGSYTMIYIGKDTSRDELYEHVKKYKFFIAPDVD
ncbi:MAG: hypothetical protein OEY93_07080, partial [Anaerolineae bacterium]|nr:hypothetical protein [Anaerolineae bacterium]